MSDLSRVPACGRFGPGKALPALADAPDERPDIGKDRNQLEVLRGVLSRQSRSSLVLEAFANSAPWWLTVSGCPQGNPDALKAYDNLAAAAYGAYADYLAQVLLAFHERGIRFDTLDLLNEPENPWGQRKGAYVGQLFCAAGCQEGMHLGLVPPRLPTPSLGLLLDEVCGRLRAHAIGTTVSVPDGSNPSFTGALLGLAGAAPACLGQINTHMYGPEALTSGRQAVSIAAHTLSTRIWMSEFGIGGVASDMASGLTYSSVIAADMRWLRPAAWVNWQAVEARGGWGLLESPTWPREGPVTRTKRFSALAQYARFIRPGYQILTTLDPLDDAVHERTGGYGGDGRPTASPSDRGRGHELPGGGATRRLRSRKPWRATTADSWHRYPLPHYGRRRYAAVGFDAAWRHEACGRPAAALDHHVRNPASSVSCRTIAERHHAVRK